MMIVILLCSLIYHQNSYKKVVESIHSDRELRWLSTDIYLSRTRATENIRAYFLSSEPRYLRHYREDMVYFNENIILLLTYPQGKLLHELNIKLKDFSDELSLNTQLNLDLINMGFPNSAIFLWEEETQGVRGNINLVFSQINETLNADIANRIDRESQKQNQSFSIALMLSLLASLVGGIVGFRIARSLIRPIEIIRSSASEMSKGNFHINLPFDGKDEVSRLGQSLNSMAARIYSQLDSSKIKAADEERKRIARDIHDELSQTLFAAKLIAKNLSSNYCQKNSRENAELVLLSQQLNSAHTELRSLITQMTHGYEKPFDLRESISHFLHVFSQRNAITLQTSIDIPYFVPSEVQITFFRILQEGLNNVEKHAQANKVQLYLRPYTPDLALKYDDIFEFNLGLELDIRDNGIGLASPLVSGLGIEGMRQRARGIGALFNLSTSKEGAQINLRWESKNYAEQS